jgi:small conductance mechanosensitive channel
MRTAKPPATATSTTAIKIKRIALPVSGIVERGARYHSPAPPAMPAPHAASGIRDKTEREMLDMLNLQNLTPTLAVVAGVLLLLVVVERVCGRAIHQYAERMAAGHKEHHDIHQWARQLNHLLRQSVAAVAAIAFLVLMLRGLGVHGFSVLTWEQVTTWMLGPGLRILLVLGGAYTLSRLVRMFILRLPAFAVRRPGSAAVAERETRAQTVGGLLGALVTVVLMSIAGLIVVREVGVDIMPILTGAGIAGLAVGFGAQNLVRDVISGFFVILEDQIRVGDIAVINGKLGLVEAIHLRTTVVRGFDGAVHIFPNGAINEVSNLTKDYSCYVIQLNVAWKEDVDQVMEVLKQIGDELRRDPQFAPKILEPLEIEGVDQFAPGVIVIKMRIKTVPLEQFVVGRELRRRIKKTFDAHGIELPRGELSLSFDDTSKPFLVEMAEKLREEGKAGGGSR